MKISVIGTRGFPNIQGGVEKHCESLYPIIAEKGFDVKIFRRKPFINENNNQINFQRVRFINLWTVKTKGFEALIHSVIAAFICLYEKPNIVHIHNIGPSLILPLLKLGRIKTTVTYHSSNYNHKKWGWFARKLLMIGENFVNKMADEIIYVSKVQESIFSDVNKTYIPNGVNIPDISSSCSFLSEINVEPKKYIFAIGRFSHEKGLHILIEAFQIFKKDYHLVIAGDEDNETKYGRKLKKMIADNDRIVHTGYITGEPLNQLYSHASLFVLPSYHEGLPIALLEAMSYGLPVLVSDIPANLEVGLSHERYFRCGDVEDLYGKMKILIEKGISDKEAMEMRNRILNDYNWEKIAKQTIAVYERVVKEGKD